MLFIICELNTYARTCVYNIYVCAYMYSTLICVRTHKHTPTGAVKWIRFAVSQEVYKAESLYEKGEGWALLSHKMASKNCQLDVV